MGEEANKRAERLRAALRDNLRKRKAQSRSIAQREGEAPQADTSPDKETN